MSDPSPQTGNLRPHQLARDLAAALHKGARILDFAAGSGRNTAFLRAAGFTVESVSDADAPAFHGAPQPFDAAISTHGLLHGTPESIREMLELLEHSLRPGAPLYVTFASIRDGRFGKGHALGPNTFAPDDGEEAGVAHSFFDENAVREMLSGSFHIESIEEHNAEHIPDSVHWFLRARRAGVQH